MHVKSPPRGGRGAGTAMLSSTGQGTVLYFTKPRDMIRDHGHALERP